MLIKTLPVGQLETNCYVVTNENTLESVVIDPGDEANTILDYLESNRLRCAAIFVTHARAVDAHMTYRMQPGDKAYDEGDTVEAAGLRFDVMATPGHTPGGVTLRCEDALFTGDTLFKGSCGRTDLPGGDMEQELSSLRRICELPGDYEVYPGHMDSSTLERERAFNYYCRAALRR